MISAIVDKLPHREFISITVLIDSKKVLHSITDITVLLNSKIKDPCLYPFWREKYYTASSSATPRRHTSDSPYHSVHSELHDKSRLAYVCAPRVASGCLCTSFCQDCALIVELTPASSESAWRKGGGLLHHFLPTYSFFAQSRPLHTGALRGRDLHQQQTANSDRSPLAVRSCST